MSDIGRQKGYKKGIAMKIGNCALCKEDKNLCKSHIIPKSIFRQLRKEDSGKSIQINSNGNTEITQNDFSEYLLCLECEQIIKKYESYGIPFFRRGEGDNYLKKISGVTFKEIDYSLIKQYLVSLIWRMSVANSMTFQDIKLSKKIQEKTRISLLKNKPLGCFILACKIKKLRDDRINELGVFEDFNDCIIKLKNPKNIYCIGIEGFFFEFYCKQFPLKNKNISGVLSRKQEQTFPYIHIKDVKNITKCIPKDTSENSKKIQKFNSIKYKKTER